MFFFFNDPATTEIYTLSLHDALPILRAVLVPHRRENAELGEGRLPPDQLQDALVLVGLDRKSTRLNSSHVKISYAVFCLKKKKIQHNHPLQHYWRSDRTCQISPKVLR